MYNLAIIIPTRNEIASIDSLVERLSNSLNGTEISFQIIFIDGNSRDGTYEKLLKLNDKNISSYLQLSKGKALAVIEGVGHAESEYVCMIDADLQYPPEAIPEMYRMIGECNLVVARREVNNEKFLRKTLSKIHKYIFGNLLFGLSCDIQSGLKLFPKSLIYDIDTSDITPWTLDLALLLAAKKRGYKIGEVAIDFEERKFGESKVSIFGSIGEHLYTALRFKLKGLRS